MGPVDRPVNSSPTLSRIARVIATELGANVTEADLRGVTALDQVVSMDSIGLLEFALGLEREFAIRLEPRCMDHKFLLDLPRLVDYLDGDAAVGAR